MFEITSIVFVEIHCSSLGVCIICQKVCTDMIVSSWCGDIVWIDKDESKATTGTNHEHIFESCYFSIFSQGMMSHRMVDIKYILYLISILKFSSLSIVFEKDGCEFLSCGEKCTKDVFRTFCHKNSFFFCKKNFFRYYYYIFYYF